MMEDSNEDRIKRASSSVLPNKKWHTLYSSLYTLSLTVRRNGMDAECVIATPPMRLNSTVASRRRCVYWAIVTALRIELRCDYRSNPACLLIILHAAPYRIHCLSSGICMQPRADNVDWNRRAWRWLAGANYSGIGPLVSRERDSALSVGRGSPVDRSQSLGPASRRRGKGRGARCAAGPARPGQGERASSPTQ